MLNTRCPIDIIYNDPLRLYKKYYLGELEDRLDSLLVRGMDRLTADVSNIIRDLRKEFNYNFLFNNAVGLMANAFPLEYPQNDVLLNQERP